MGNWVQLAILLLFGSRVIQGQNNTPRSVCYNDLGCITIDDSWYHTLYRPVNLLPLPRDDISTRFTLHTRKDPTTAFHITASNVEGIRKAFFNAANPTKLIIHGFISNGNVTWIQKLTRNLLAAGDFNVIVVNWGGGSRAPYTQATANTRLVGREIAHLVNTMVRELGVDPGNVHLIGHSLGSHTAGYAGEKIPNLGRITALDPAGPYFQHLPKHVRLDPGDAKFVDAIHTDASSTLVPGYGMEQPVGHLDFYVNGGSFQPGCNPVENPLHLITDSNETATNELEGCSHLRAVDLYTDALLPGCNYIGYECASHEAFLRGDCASCGADNSRCAVFGLDAAKYPLRNRTNVMLYFNTGKDAPYCKSHYHVKVALAKPTGAQDRVYGTLKLTLFGTTGKNISADLTPSGSKRFDHGQVAKFLYVGDTNVGNIQRVELFWDYDTLLSARLFCIFFCNDDLYVASVEISDISYYPESNRLAHTYKSCPYGAAYIGIDNRATGKFYPTACA